MVWSEAEKVVLPVALLLVVLTTLTIFLLTKNKSGFIKKLPLLIISVVMVMLEIVKQVIGFSTGYSFWRIPLHFCSFFLFWAMLATFSKSKKYSEIGFSMAVAFGGVFLLMFYINPSSIIGNSSQNIMASFNTFHTFVYHHLMILFLMLTFSQKQFKPRKNHTLWVVVLYSLYAVLAIVFAHLLQVNFTNLLTSNIAFMQAINDRFGIIVYTIILYLFGLFGCLGSFGASKLVYSHNIKNKVEKT